MKEEDEAGEAAAAAAQFPGFVSCLMGSETPGHSLQEQVCSLSEHTLQPEQLPGQGLVHGEGLCPRGHRHLLDSDDHARVG